MKAIGYRTSLPITDPHALEDTELPTPEPGPRDLLVRVEAVSVNPVDAKVRMRAQPESGHRVLGFDAAGTVRAVGDSVTGYKVGDEVFYAGDVTRPGTNAEYHVVDERIVGRKPESLSMPEAAALPLTGITAWELLFDSFGLAEGDGNGDTLLVIGGAGGVGSMLTQIAGTLTGLDVIVTASRPESRQWCLNMGTDQVIDHSQPLAGQLQRLNVQPRYVAALTASDRHFDAIVELIRPRGRIGMIDDPGALDVAPLKQKSLSFHWEFMFARPMFATDDMQAQRDLLNRISELVDAGRIRTTANRNLGPMSAASLIEGHRLQESGRMIGKTVLEGIG